MDYVIAFVVGGVICALTQILMEKTKLLPGRIMVLLVCSGCVLEQSASMNRLSSGLVRELQFRCLVLEMCCGKA